MPKNNPASLVSLRKPDYKGSWWKDYVKERTTLPIGLFTPIRTFDIPAKTLFKVKPDIRFESLPMLSPLYDGFTMRTKFYFVPYRLYIPELRVNRQLAWGAISNFRFPVFNVQHRKYAAENQAITNRQRVSLAGSLLDRLGISYGDMLSGQSFNNISYLKSTTTNVETHFVNAVKFIAYLDCWLRGEYNHQDKNIPVLDEIFGYSTGNSDSRFDGLYRFGTYKYLSYDLLRKFVDRCCGFSTDIDASLTDITLSSLENGRSATISGLESTLSTSLYPLTTLFQNYNIATGDLTMPTNGVYNTILDRYWSELTNSSSNVGLLPITYKGDYLMSWFNAESISKLEMYVVNNGDSLLSLRRKNADMMMELLASISGNTYVDILQFVFDTHLELKDHPIMIGYDEIHFGANEDTTATTSQDSAEGVFLGSVASKAREYSNKVKPISVKTQEPGMIMVFSSIIPNIVYYQGVDRFDLKLYWRDLWHPQYDSRGFQGIQPEEYYNPFTTPRYGDEAPELYDGWNQLVSNNYVSPRVPLGWEYMKRNSRLSGAMKLDRFKTWSLIHDFRTVGFTSVQPLGSVAYNNDIQLGERFNPLDTSVDSTLRAFWMSDLCSTYVKGFDYNIPFANYDAFDNQNFVVNFGFLISQYQPITHTLITKNI